MKFGIFDYIDQRDEPLNRLYDDRMELISAAEQAGFTGYHVTEHHVTPLSTTPSPSIFLAAAARCSICCRSTIRSGCWKNSACSII
jgi:hypothetical protein